MRLEITEEEIEKEYNGGDQDINVLEVEMLLYFQSDNNFLIQREYKYVILTEKNENKKFYLRGDNLITKKKMFLKIFSRYEYLKNKIENDNHIYFFILMPHILKKSKCQINSKRASVGEYNDNPFVFFESLRKMYCSNFEKEVPDLVEQWIIINKDFWGLIGEGINGYKNYLEVFCLQEISEIMESSNVEYKKIFDKKIIPKEWGEEEWEQYVNILYVLRDKRKESMKARLKKINSNL